jgi:hypothetical protein
MRIPDQSFSVHDGLNRALELLALPSRGSDNLPLTLPESGFGDLRAPENAIGSRSRQGRATRLAHFAGTHGSGNFSTLSKTLALNVPGGFLDGNCKKIEA